MSSEELYLKTIGMGENEDFYSKMIRDGVITRDEIMERLSKENVIQYDQIEGCTQSGWLKNEYPETDT